MYDNTVRLIGFLGKDAEVKSTKSGNEYTVLSLATQASWKDKKSGEYVNRTEWHRMIAWANLSTFAATLKKGTHLSVEGELRYREFNDKKRKKVKVRLAEIQLGTGCQKRKKSPGTAECESGQLFGVARPFRFRIVGPSYRTGRKRFCNMSAIPRGAYLLKFIESSAECFMHLAPCYIRAIAFLCAPLTGRKLHRSIAFTGRNSCLRACRKRGLS